MIGQLFEDGGGGALIELVGARGEYFLHNVAEEINDSGNRLRRSEARPIKEISKTDLAILFKINRSVIFNAIVKLL